MRTGTSPDERQERNDRAKEQAKLDALRDVTESQNVRTRSRIDAGTAQVRTSGRGIEGAIKAMDFRPTIIVNLPRPGTFTYRTGGTLSSTRLNKLTDLAAT